MCYLIAKKFNERGCIALETERGKALAALVEYLSIKTLEHNIQILTVSDMDTFSEYKPYKLIDSESEFISKVLNYDF